MPPMCTSFRSSIAHYSYVAICRLFTINYYIPSEPIPERIQNGSGYRITGVYGSLLIFETNILTTDRAQNGGIYTCRVCTDEGSDMESCVTRNTTVYLVGERPILKPLGQ